MQHNFKYKGMTRVPSDHDSFEGEMEEVYNLVNKNGELRPVVPPDVIGSITGEFLFVHKTASYEHFITQDYKDLKAYKFENGVIIPTALFVFQLLADEDLIKIESVGNTLIVLTTMGIKYALWKDTAYKYLGSEIPFPNIRFELENVVVRDSDLVITLPDTYSEDFTKLRAITGYKDGRGGRSTGVRYQPPTTNDPINPDYQYVTSHQIISNDFQNSVKGKINTFLASVEEQQLFVFPFFVRYALRLYDGSLISHSQPFLMLPTKFLPFQAGIKNVAGDKSLYVYFPRVSKLNYSHEIEVLSDYKDIIESLDIFISDSIYTYLYDGNINGGMINPLYDSANTKSPELIFGGIYKSKETILKEISSVGNFYKIKSLSIDSLSNSISKAKIEAKNLNTLVNQEPMTDDYLTHDTIIAKNSFTYNDKLHLTGIEREPFKGFSYGMDTRYLWNEVSTIDVGNQPFLFYPGKQSEVFLEKRRNIGAGIQYAYKTFPLSNHPYLNGSYYLNPELEEITFKSEDYGPRIIRFPSPTQKYSEQNKIYVSEMQNPFVFPAKSRITLPVGKILAVSSNTQAISSGQFGQFPLYAFTDDGIWALEMNQEGSYLARQAVSREVCVNPHILQMDSHIAFITAKGLTVLSGSENECISDIISDINTRFPTSLNVEPFFNALNSNNLLFVFQTIEIEEYLKNATLAYEYINGNGRIFAINETYDYAYVFDILSKTWSKVHSNYKRVVNNYPDCYVQTKDNEVVNLATIGKSKAAVKVMFVTRPFTMSDKLFNIRALIHRGIFQSGINTAIYGSRDGVDYMLVASSSKFALRAIGTPFRYFKFVTIANLFPHESLSGVHLDVEPRYENRIR